MEILFTLPNDGPRVNIHGLRAHFPHVSFVDEPEPEVLAALGVVRAVRVETLEERRRARQAEAEELRKIKEAAGISLPSGARVETDRTSQTMIANAVAFLQNDPALHAVDFKSPDGWMRVDRDAMVQLGVAVGRHMQDCFTREKRLSAAIEAAATIAAVDALDLEALWTGA